MQRTNYNFPTSIRFGEGVIDELSDYLVSNGLKPLSSLTQCLRHWKF